MKCLPLITLVAAVSFVSVASAQTDEPRVKKNAAIAKSSQRAVHQPRAIARTNNAGAYNAGRNLNAGGAAAFRASRGHAGASYNSDISVQPRGGRPIISRTRTFQPRPVVTSGGSAVFTPNRTGIRDAGARRGNGRTGVTRNHTARIWNGNGNANNAAAWRNHEHSGGDNDWQNRNGDENSAWDRHHWSNRRNWDRQHRNRSWWRSHYTRFALFGGGYYYWNGGYWYPAYGYDPGFRTYVYDAPIYGYNGLEPQQVIASVQQELERRGYDPGGVDGDFGPMTRRALLDYQQDNGLDVTGEIDEATLNALGLQ